MYLKMHEMYLSTILRVYLYPVITIISRAGTFAGDHGCPKRIVRGTESAIGRALWRLLHSLQDLSGNAQRRFLRDDLAHGKFLFRVKGCKLGTQAQAAHGDHSNATPFSVHRLEDRVHHFLRGLVAFKGHGTLVSVLYLRLACLELLNGSQHPHQ